MTAFRLIGWIADNLGEVDGHLLLAGGPGLGYLSARQACNVAYAMITRSLETDQDRRQFEAELNEPADPWEAANQLWSALKLPKAGE